MNTRLTRRSALWLGWAPFVRPVRSSAAVTAGPNQFPRPGDLLVSQAGSRAGAVINPGDIAPGQPPLRAWAMDPDSRALRDRSFFDQILLVRLGPATLTAAEVPLAANGIVGYSAICTHAGCVVVGWKPAERQLLCPCHGSVYDPAACGRVIAGPAPRPLPALPLRINDGVLTVAAEFTARIGGSTGRTD